MRRKMGWTVNGIVGSIFAPIGLLFTVLALILSQSETVSWRHADDSIIFFAVFGGVGGLFLILGLIFLGADLRRRHLLRRAYDGGNRVDAKIINGSHPRVIECAYTDASGVVHVYRSRYLYTDVTPFLTSETVPVYIDRFDENIGFVDIDAVLPEIRIHS